MKKIFTFAIAVLCASASFASTSTEAASALAKRLMPSLAKDITFELIQSPKDTFAVSAKRGKVLIEGNNTLSMAVGLNHYMRNQLGTSVSWFDTKPVQVPKKVILPEAPYGAKAGVDDRFFLNYCTFGYTMPYWGWNEWERFIDWMALNGVTMPLAMTGAEQSWYQTWRSFGLSDEEIRNSFTGPGHLPWHWMNNIDHFQGPLPLDWLKRQEELQKQILKRERQFGMTPVLPAFAGHVPLALKKYYPDAHITEVSQWGEFPIEDRCYFLNPSDPLYTEIQKRFIETQTKLYGSDHIYGIDPFNEVDSPDWSEEFLNKASKGIFATLQNADPAAKWLQMTWNFYYDRKHWTKPRIQAFLNGVEGDNMILLDYFCDNIEIWRRSDKYFNKPYVWCYLGNFGGNTMMCGNLKDVAEKITKTYNEGGDNFSGLGGTLEGLDSNPIIHEFVLAKAWHPNMTADEWAAVWANSRGGKNSPEIVEAWKLLVDSVLIERTTSGHACLTNARPVFEKPTTHYSRGVYKYADKNLHKAIELLLSAQGVDDNAAYQFDVMNTMRQALGNEFKNIRDNFTTAYRNKDINSAKTYAAQMQEVFEDIDRLMATDPKYSLSQWISDARGCASTKEDADNYEKNVRTLLTIWGYTDKDLNDYANRQWSGMMKNFYGHRWKMFTDAAISALEAGVEFNETATNEAIKNWEGEWTNMKEPQTPVSKENPVKLAQKLYKKYFQK